MKDWIYIDIPNEGGIPVEIRLLKKKELVDVNIIGDRTFFNMEGTTLSMDTNDYKEYFVKE